MTLLGNPRAFDGQLALVCHLGEDTKDGEQSSSSLQDQPVILRDAVHVGHS